MTQYFYEVLYCFHFDYSKNFNLNSAPKVHSRSKTFKKGIHFQKLPLNLIKIE